MAIFCRGEKSGPKNQELGLHRSAPGLFYFLTVMLSSADSESKKRKLVVSDPIYFNWVFCLLISQLERLKSNFEGAPQVTEMNNL